MTDACPSCGSRVLYRGLTTVECEGHDCPNGVAPTVIKPDTQVRTYYSIPSQLAVRSGRDEGLFGGGIANFFKEVYAEVIPHEEFVPPQYISYQAHERLVAQFDTHLRRAIPYESVARFTRELNQYSRDLHARSGENYVQRSVAHLREHYRAHQEKLMLEQFGRLAAACARNHDHR